MSGIEVAGLVLGVVPLIISASEFLGGPGVQRRSVRTPIRPPITSSCYLRVCDFSHVKDVSPLVVGTTNNRTELKDNLRSLPEQEEKSFRVYLIEGSLTNDSDLLDHFRAGDFPSDISPLHVAGNMFEALASQWRGSGSMWYELETYCFEYGEVIDYTKYHRVNGGLAFLAGLIRMSMTIQIIDIAGKKDKSVVVILCQALANPVLENLMEKTKKGKSRAKLENNQWKTVIEQLERFSRHLLRSNHLYKRIPQPLTSLESLKQLFLLRYYSAILNHYSLFLSEVRREYVLERESLMDPRYSILRPSILKEITADAYIYEEFHNIALDLTDPVAGLIAVLGSAFPDANQCQEFRAFTAELHFQCTDIIKTASRFSSRLDHHLKFLDVSRNMHESLRVWILSVLASVFLPLSIATGLLSMQNRFINLQMLLYDFCGVVVLLGTILFMIFRLVHGYVFLKERFEMWRPNSVLTRVAKKVMTYNAVATVFYIWVLLLASFLVGMIKNSGLGGRILGFGLAALFGLVALAIAGAGVLYLALRSMGFFNAPIGGFR